MKQHESYSCNKCRNVIEVQNVGGGTLLCCDEKMHSTISWLFIVTNESAILKSEGSYDGKTVGNHFIIDLASNITAFSDRPNRQAKKIEGGLNSFVKFYDQSNFMTNPPNATFAGVSTETTKENSTVFEMEIPFVYQEKFIIPIKTAIGDEVLPSYGNYADINFVIDDILGIGHFVTSVVDGGANLAAQAADKAAKLAAQAAEEAAKLATQVADKIAHLATQEANGVAALSVFAADQIASTATSVYKSTVSDVKEGVKEVAKVAVEIEHDAEKEAEHLLKVMAKDAEGSFKSIMNGLTGAMNDLNPTSIADAFTERHMDKLADAFIHLLKSEAEALINIVNGKQDTFLIMQGTLSEGTGEVGGFIADGFGINLTNIINDLRAMYDNDFNSETFKQQIIDGSLIECFVAGGVSMGIDIGESFGVTVGLSFGSTLDAETLDFNLGATFEEGTEITVSLSIPSDKLYIDGYILGGISIGFNAGAKATLDIGGTYTKSISISDFMSNKKAVSSDNNLDNITTEPNNTENNYTKQMSKSDFVNTMEQLNRSAQKQANAKIEKSYDQLIKVNG